MNRSIRRVALGLGLVFLALFANLNYIQLGRSDDLSRHAKNRRNIIREYGTRRGEIIAADDTVLARSVESSNERYRFEREYPEGDLFGHITGYYSFTYGASGLERVYNDVLLGREPSTTATFVDDLLGREPAGNRIILTVEPRLQRIAKRALGGQRGAAALIDSRSGAVLALYANPSYDPQPLSIDPAKTSRIQRAWTRYTTDQMRPLTFRASQERYFAGSTFKVIVAATGLENKMTPNSTFPNPSRLDLPDTDRTLGNFTGGACPAGSSISMSAALRVSCNTTFAQIAMRVGPEKLSEMATRFGLNAAPSYDFPATASCVVNVPGGACGDPLSLSRPATAYTGIGQQSVGVTPLGMAVVAGTVGNGGRRPTPYLVQRIQAPDGSIIRETPPDLSKRIYRKRTGRWLRDMMIGTVRSGTGAVVGFRDAARGIIGGKTGTAETGTGAPPHVWFIAFAPGLSVAVVVENGGDLGDAATGGRVAGPIAKRLLEAAMDLQEDR